MTYALVILTHFTQTVRTRLDDVLTAYPECVNTHPEPIHQGLVTCLGRCGVGMPSVLQ